MASRLDAFRSRPEKYVDDPMGIQVCREALRALEEGNYGVGAIITGRNGEIIVRSRNQVFEPTFRSDGHAEMVALNDLERRRPQEDPASLTLYVSLEPCPMCLSRLKLAGVGRVRYLASDAAGGMVHLHDRLPPIWRLLNPDQDFDQANVSPALSRLAVRLFQVNLRSLRRRLLNRVHPGR
jgi:tRNA(adenine34) deaminase